MTISEALNHEVNNQGISDKSLILVGLDGTQDFTIAVNSTVELAKAYAFKSIITQPDWAEDGQSATYSRAYLTKEANRIFKLNGKTSELINFAPIAKNASRKW